MNWYEWVLLVLELPVVWFIWTALHELSHVAVAKMFLNVVKVNYWLYPHYDNNNFYFARVQYFHDLSKDISRLQEAFIYLAPRVMNIVAAISLLFFSYLPTPWNYVWFIFWGAGLVDFIVGSLGISPYSDLRSAADSLQINPYILRICGFALITLSIVFSFIIFLI